MFDEVFVVFVIFKELGDVSFEGKFIDWCKDNFVDFKVFCVVYVVYEFFCLMLEKVVKNELWVWFFDFIEWVFCD